MPNEQPGRLKRLLRKSAPDAAARIEHDEAPDLEIPAWAQVTDAYYDDGLMKLWERNVESLQDERFVDAYRAGMRSGHKFFLLGTDKPIDMPWRAYIACWAATHALAVPGDFVECGVNTGTLALTICHYVDFNATDKAFYLFDTYSGIPEEQMTDSERPRAQLENEVFYEDCYDLAVRNFEPFPRAHLVRGVIPRSLSDVQIDRVSYLSLDMNIVAPELAAIEFFWPKLSSAAVVLLDDYGWRPHRDQKAALDAFAMEHGGAIATLPTGQGLLIKP